MIAKPIQGLPRRIFKTAAYGVAKLLSVLAADREYAFILSHMRSGSSLLTHILVSNPEVLGYGETMTRYTAPRDFDLLALKIAIMSRRIPGPERYLIDKLLHNVLLPPAGMKMLISRKVRLIFLLRPPEDSLSSLVRSLGYTPEQAVEYYAGRLDMVHRYAEHIPPGYPAIAITHHQLVYETEAVFELLGSILNLHTPLSERYELLPTTGKPGVGDFSAHIWAGHIIRPNVGSSGTSLLDFSTVKKSEQARQTYFRCKQFLDTVCHVLDRARFSES